MTAAVFIGRNWGRFNEPFGNNSDGQNAGVFTAGARSIQHLGLIDSRLGAVLWPDGNVYANHPPLIYWLTAVTDAVGGGHPFAIRALTIVGALASIILLDAIARRAGLSRWSAALGTSIALACPMFVVHGPMLDTLMIGFPLALAMLLTWWDWRSGADVSNRRLGTLVIIASLAAWQSSSIWMVMLLASALLADREPAGGRRFLLKTGATAIVMNLAWIWWANGSFAALVEQFRTRSGGSHLALTDRWNLHLGNLAVAYRPALVVAVVAGIISVFVPKWPGRPRHLPLLIMVSVAGTGAYTVVFSEGAAVHRYWTYWYFLPATLGIGALLERSVHHRGPDTGRTGVVWRIGVALAVTLVGTGSSDLSAAHQQGVRVARLLDNAPLADDQPLVGLGFPAPVSWMSISNERRVLNLSTDEVDEVARDHPRWSVFVNCQPTRENSHPELCAPLRALGHRGNDLAVIAPASDVANALLRIPES